ncbi:sialomucin core protein 24-like [Heptranchias perlo]|uniref:sialomucin core protein 24-like n=1 Tax=Heptranchias perlo TaxID=212740 RepID=UPI00355AA38E
MTSYCTLKAVKGSNMRPRIWLTAFYTLFTLCVVVLAVNSANATEQKVTATTGSLGNEGNSSEDLNTTATSNSRFGTGPKQNMTSNNMTTLTPGTTVATSTNSVEHSVLDSSQSPMTPTPTVQTTAPRHVSSHSAPKSSPTPTLNSTAIKSQVTTTSQVSSSISTPVLKPTQTEFAVTSRQPNSTDVTQPYTGSLYSILTTGTSGSVLHLRKQEIIVTICLSTILGVVILTIIMYNVTKCKRRRAQYSHRPLYTSSYEEPGGSYNIPDDTLVISGGLYDESRVYNPNMTVLEEDDEIHSEYPAFSSKYSQFRLEFLPEESEATDQRPSFDTFKAET